jgi:HTH-type transcriptional regulator / antitoxin HigA
VITNERQYRITKAQLAKLQEGVDKFDLEETAQRLGSRILAQAGLDGLKSEVEVLADQLKEYESLQSGVATNFRAASLTELDTLLIRARIARRLSQRELAEKIGVKEQQIQRYEAQKYAGASLRRVIEIARALNIDADQIAEKVPFISDVIEWDKFPVRIMYKRGWFEEFSGSLDDMKQVANELVEYYITSNIRKPTVALHRKSVRSGSPIDSYALLAWECRILALAAKEKNVREFRGNLLTLEWINELRKLSSHKDGPKQAKAMLEESGIALMIEPHLPDTYLDGAAFLVNGIKPVIGLTLRYDRLDNFWFVLFHELIHIMKHLKKGRIEHIFDNDVEEGVTDKIEREADMLAGEALISPGEWDRALPRFVQTKETIEVFASQIGISPAIVAGRIRRESKNYTILSDLVGRGEVRKLFSEINFGV